jgi:5-methylcytosine-specific restriction endonuclease McrA
MNYFNIYNNLIERAKNRVLEGYCEMHHIIPKCMNGSNDSSNLVALTANEHYIAHLLLVKMYPKNESLWYAANMMANRNNKEYAWTKKNHAKIVSRDKLGFNHTDEAKKKMKNAIANRWIDNPEGFAEEQRRRSARPKNKKDGYFQPKSEKHAKNISEAALKRDRHACPHCGKLITKANINNHMKVHNNVNSI